MPCGVYIRTKAICESLSRARKKEINSGRFGKGNLHWNWKGGVSSNKREFLREWRHKNGISKKYNTGISASKEYKRLYRKRWKYSLKNAGKLSIKIIQQVYEDNIKLYGTLTCYLCCKPIEFGKDHLEHKTPLVRGGTNVYSNLAVACQGCNCKKNKKTEEEYRKAVCVL